MHIDGTATSTTTNTTTAAASADIIIVVVGAVNKSSFISKICRQL